MWDSMLKGFFLAYIEIIIGFVSLFYILFLFHKYKGSDYYSVDYKMPPYLKLYVLLPVVIALSFFFHPGNKNNYYYTNQMFVSLGIFSEAIGLLPQLYYIRRVNDTGNVSQYYGVCLAIARFFRLLFWIRMYFDGNKFMSLIVADVIHCIFLFDFTYKVLTNWNKPIIPTFGNTVEQPSSKKIF
jgi:ER lumen protein retaining receptor